MEIRPAQPSDLSHWLDVAKDVGEIMRCPHMDADPRFLAYAQRKLAQNNAIMAYDEDQKKCAGFVGFSVHNNTITWLGIQSGYRKQGIGSMLLLGALERLDGTKRIALNTYPIAYLPGRAARDFYRGHGFTETSGEVFVIDGYEMVEFHKDPIDS